jgi:acetyltransferase-like isoleucine patch superfamily enzyme
MSKCQLGDGCRVAESANILPPESGQSPARIGSDSVVRAGSVIYPDVVTGDRLQTGHHAVVREETTVGHDCVVGSQAVVDGRTDIGDEVRMQTGAYVPAKTTIGDRVFLGPQAALTNDPYPLRRGVDLGVIVGERSFVAAGAVVTEDVPPSTLAVGTPAKHRPLPEKLVAANTYR